MNRNIFERAIANTAGTVADGVRAEVMTRREAPCVWAEYHRIMVQRLPRWAWLRRLIHRALRRRMAAQCLAQQKRD